MHVVLQIMYIEVRLPYTRRAFFLWWPDRVKEEACKKRTLTMEREASNEGSFLLNVSRLLLLLLLSLSWFGTLYQI